MLLIAAGISFWAFLNLLPDRSGPPRREEIILDLGELRSNIAGQPTSRNSSAIIRAPVGHPQGHVVSTVPKELPTGEYRYEIDADFEVGRKYDDATCLMDLLAGAELVAVEDVYALHDTEYFNPGLTFKSPAKSGANVFQARLYCDGRASVVVRSVKLIRNPSSPPRVIIQH